MPEEKDQPSRLSDRKPEEQGNSRSEAEEQGKDNDPNPLAPPVNIGAGS